MPGATLHPRSLAAKLHKEMRTRSIQVQRRRSGISRLRNGLTAMGSSPRLQDCLVAAAPRTLLSHPVGRLLLHSTDANHEASDTRFCRTQRPVFAKMASPGQAPFVLRA